jgi:hypothetical protein
VVRLVAGHESEGASRWHGAAAVVIAAVAASRASSVVDLAAANGLSQSLVGRAGRGRIVADRGR